MTMIAPAPPPLLCRRPPRRHAAPEGAAREHVGEQGDRPDEHADQQAEADVVVLDVRQLVAEDALELLAVELLEQARRHRDAGVLRVTAGREGIGRGVVDDVDARLGDVGREAQLAHDVDELRGVLPRSPRAPATPPSTRLSPL